MIPVSKNLYVKSSTFAYLRWFKLIWNKEVSYPWTSQHLGVHTGLNRPIVSSIIAIIINTVAIMQIDTP